MENGNGAARLDRIERMLEMLAADHVAFADEHKKLLTAQVLLTDAQRRSDERLTAAQLQTEEKLNGLIAVVDGLIRNRPPAA